MFAAYNGVSARAAFILPVVARATSGKVVYKIVLKVVRMVMHNVVHKMVHKMVLKAVRMACLVIGVRSLAGVFLMTSWQMLLAMVGVGIAWASVLPRPCAIPAGSLPANRMGFS